MLDIFSPGKDLLSPAQIDICRCNIIQGFMIPVIIVILYKFSNLTLKFFGTVIVFQLNYVFHRSMVSFNLALSLRMKRFASNNLIEIAYDAFFFTF